MVRKYSYSTVSGSRDLGALSRDVTRGYASPDRPSGLASLERDVTAGGGLVGTGIIPGRTSKVSIGAGGSYQGTDRRTQEIIAQAKIGLQQQKQALESRVQSLESKAESFQNNAQQVLDKYEALGRAQAQVNRGAPISREDAQTLGLPVSYALRTSTAGQRQLNMVKKQLNNQIQGLQKTQTTLNTSSAMLQSEINSFNQNASQLGVSSTSYSPAELSRLEPTVFQGPSKVKAASLSESNVRPVRTTQNIGEALFLSGQEAIFGEQPKGTGLKVTEYAGKGGVFQRTQEAFFSALKGGEEIGKGVGKRVAGEPGAQLSRVIGVGAGAAYGGLVGVLEPTVGSVGKLYGGSVQRLSGSKQYGELVEAGVTLVGGLKAAPKVGGAVLRSGGKLVEQAPILTETLGFPGLAVRTERVIAAGSRGLETGRIIPASIYSGSVERGVSAIGAGARQLRNISQARTLTGPVAVAGSLVIPEAREKLETVTISPQTLEKRNVAAIQQGYQNLAQINAKQGIVGQIGGELGFGAFQRFETLGGKSNATIEKAFRDAYISQGYSKVEAQRQAIAERKLYRARQSGVIGGLLSVSTGTELMGSSFITPVVERNVLKAGIQPTIGAALKVGKKTAIRTVPGFASLGILEGLTSTGITEIGQYRAPSVKNLPQRIIESPLTFAIGGATGAISAPLLGAPIVGLGVARTVKPTKSLFRKGGQDLLLYGGYVLDPFEEPGDFLATFFGKREPAFKINTKVKTGEPVLELLPAFEPTKPKGKVTQNVGLFTQQTQASNLIPNLTTNENVSVTQQNNNISSNLPNFNFGVNLLSNQFNENVNVNLEQQTEQNVTQPVATPIMINIPIATPLSRAGAPLFFPGAGLPSSGLGKGGRRGRVKYINELALAFGTFRKNLQVKPIDLGLRKKRRK